ncbi:MAG: hypothetical protein ACO4B4_08370 [Planctomycetota bacterium]
MTEEIAHSGAGSGRDTPERSPAGVAPRRSPPAEAFRRPLSLAAVDREAVLREFLHPDLIPPGERSRGVTPLERAIADEGVCLDQLLRGWSGGTLEHWQRRCPGGIPQLLDSFVRLSRLLHELKGAGWIVPRVHPRWIRLGVDGRLRLRGEDLLRDQGISPSDWAPYLAPELLIATGSGLTGGEESAVYSLAAILHHCLAGAPPWSGRDETEVADRLLAEVPPSAIPESPDIPRGIAPLLAEALALDPRRRPGRFRGFAAALEAAAQGGRPRSAPSRVRDVGARPRSIARLALLLGLFLLLVQGVRGGTERRQRLNLLDRLDAVNEVRPFPIHGEDPPIHDAGVPILLDLRAEARRCARDPEVQVALGWCQLRAGQAREAVETFSTARNWDLDSASAWISLGIARLECGKRDGLLDLQRGLSLPPRSARDRLHRGVGLLYLHRFDEARAAFQVSADLDGPDHLNSFHLALSAHLAGDAEGAARALDDAARLRPLDLWGEWLVAEAALLRGDVRAARARIEERRSEWLESEALVLRAATLLARMGEEEEAREWWGRTRLATPGASFSEAVRWGPRGLLRLPGRDLLELTE